MYEARVQTDLQPSVWGAAKYFTTGTIMSLSYITSPADGAVDVATTVNVTANLINGAKIYSIELNTAPDFTGTSIIKTGTGSTRTFKFIGLQNGTTYYGRVKHNLLPAGTWGNVITSFVTTMLKGGTEATFVQPAEESITSMKIYPNPTSSVSRIELNSLKEASILQIYDLSGTMHKQQIVPLETNSLVLDVSILKPATYIIVIRNSKQVIHGRFVKL
jgi:hypothetical protein